MENNVPLYVQIPMLLIVGVLLSLAFFVFTSPLDELLYRLCLIGAFACMLGYNWERPVWRVMNLGFIAWNVSRLCLLVWK